MRDVGEANRKMGTQADQSAPEAPPPASPRSSSRLLAGCAFLLLAASLALGGWHYYQRQDAVQAEAEQRQSMVPTVRTATVKASDGTMVVTLPGTTSAFATANIFARASGYISKRDVDIGDLVKAGQLLAQITAPELDHQISQAEAAVAQTEAALRQSQASADLASVTWRRDQPLVKDGWVTKQQGDVDQQTLHAQQAAVGVSQANIAAQQSALNVLRQQKDYQSVVAPFDGVVTQRNIDVGTLVQADATSGTFMFTIIQTNVIRTQVYVPQDQAVGVIPGIDAVVQVPELPNRTFPAKVTRIADALEPTTRTLLTEIDVPNPDGALAAGIYCEVDLHIPRKVPSVIVPADAIVFNADGLQVAVFENGVLNLRKVTVVRDFGTEVEVTDGLKAGDQVIISPPVNVTPGSKVAAQPELTASSN
jgi:RND family efflux transporter MFP subunit